MKLARALALGRWASLGALLSGLFGGTLLDRSPARPEEYRAGYRVLQADFHAHTRFSDGLISPCDVVLLARRRGLDAVAVTEHNTVVPSKLARACRALVADAPIVVLGEEITTKQIHLLALGLSERVDARMSPDAIVDAVHAQHGVVVAAHPTRRFAPAVEPLCPKLDGLEVAHPLAYREGSSGFGSYADIVALARGPCGANSAMIGNSDYHGGSVLGLLRTYVFVSEVSEVGILDAIREQRTVTYAPDGTAFGPADLIEELEHEPLTVRDADYGYAGSGAADRATRALSWLGLASMIFLGWPRRRKLDGA